MVEKRIQAFAKLGEELKNIFRLDSFESNALGEKLKSNIMPAFYENGWFSEENIMLALEGISSWLSKEELQKWLSVYNTSGGGKRIGIIMAGNIPLVGFHDLLCTILSGNIAVVKMSSSDKILLPILLDRLVELEPSLKNSYEFIDRLTSFDAVIATGSNNSARYFEYYFRNKPHIIRKNRNSVAVLTGKESSESMKEFGRDIFNYYGLGCRNVSKVYFPEDYDINKIFSAITGFSDVAMNKKYANNYEYYRAIYMMNRADLLENGFFIMKEDSSLYSPVSMLFYQRYQSNSDLLKMLKTDEKNIQCIVSEHTLIKNAVPFGKSQCPSLSDYADGVDTMKFLTEL